MKEEEIKTVAENAMMIVCGYAFSKTEEGFIRVVYLHPPYHALVMPKYYDFMICGYYLYFTSHCIVEAMHS